MIIFVFVVTIIIIIIIIITSASSLRATNARNSGKSAVSAMMHVGGDCRVVVELIVELEWEDIVVVKCMEVQTIPAMLMSAVEKTTGLRQERVGRVKGHDKVVIIVIIIDVIVVVIIRDGFVMYGVG